MATVLVLDDRPDDRELMVALLTHGGHRVIEADRAERALELAAGERPDLVITDLVMPGTDGYEFVRRLRERPPLASVPVIFCTATYEEEEAADLTERMGVSRFVRKPYDPREILGIVAATLGQDPPKPTRRPAVAADGPFERSHARLLNDKLVAKIEELEAADAARGRLMAQLLAAQEDERRRIADEIHDDSIQSVVAIGLRLDVLRRRLEQPEDLEVVERLRDTIAEATGRLRNLLFELRPRELETEGVGPALRAHLSRVCPDEGLHYGVTGDVGDAASMEDRALLYRATREAVANTRKHARATRVDIELGERDSGWFARVHDDGQGFDVDAAMIVRPGHLGLPAMREQVELAGGRLTLTSRPGDGATVDMWIPCHEPGATT